MQDPVVSVVIPLHNHKYWVGDAISSVVEQDYPARQLVIVDDGSTDGSYDAVLASLLEATLLESGDVLGQTGGVPVLVLRHETPQGPAAARNTGIQAVWGGTDLYAFLDSDDVYGPTKLSRSVEKWREFPSEIGVVYSDYDTFNPTSGLLIREFKEPFSRAALVRECIVNCDSLVSKLALEKCGVFDPTLRTCEDYDLWLRISEAFVIVHVAEALVRIRVGAHSSTATVPPQAWQQNWHRVMAKAQARIHAYHQP